LQQSQQGRDHGNENAQSARTRWKNFVQISPANFATLFADF
jgi:hypothetical protein